MHLHVAAGGTGFEQPVEIDDLEVPVAPVQSHLTAGSPNLDVAGVVARPDGTADLIDRDVAVPIGDLERRPAGHFDGYRDRVEYFFAREQLLDPNPARLLRELDAHVDTIRALHDLDIEFFLDGPHEVFAARPVLDLGQDPYLIVGAAGHDHLAHRGVQRHGAPSSGDLLLQLLVDRSFGQLGVAAPCGHGRGDREAEQGDRDHGSTKHGAPHDRAPSWSASTFCITIAFSLYAARSTVCPPEWPGFSSRNLRTSANTVSRWLNRSP